MTPFTEQARWYGQFHHNPLTWYTHAVGVLLISLALILLVGFVHLIIPNVMDIQLADLAVLGLLIYYFRLNWLLALVLTPIYIFLLWIAHLFNHAGPTPFALWACAIIFVLGAIVQLVGHIMEGTRPAFTAYFKRSIASPMFITAELFFRAGWMQGLKEKIYLTPTHSYNDASNVSQNKVDEK